MKKNGVMVLCCTIILILLGGVSVKAAVYEASSLHNAVSRSETVQDLFAKRWELILEKELYIDLYGKINYIPGFKINTVNAGTGEKEATNMVLVRTYGSVTLAYPILGSYKGDLEQRMGLGEKKKEKDKEEPGLFSPKRLVLAFTATGFHYGLIRTTSVNRGDAGSETISDYKYAQFFDDIFAASVIWRPYFYIHAGFMMNREIEPNDDGTMDYGESTRSSYRIFFSSNLLSFLNINATSTTREFEAIAIGVEVNNLLGLLFKVPALIPKLTVTYKYINFFQDEAYDSVWVNSLYFGSGTVKTGSMPDDAKKSASLHTISFLVKQNFWNMILADVFFEFQTLQLKKKLVDKRTVTDEDPDGEILKLAPLREFHAKVGLNIFYWFYKNQTLITWVGISNYWDPAIPVHRNDSKLDLEGMDSFELYSLFGFFFAVTWEYPWAGAEFRVAYNYSDDLRKLVEAADKWVIEGSLYFRF
ncbi:hypothetical protein ACFL20_09190 [Spirochaetota bacterium]